MDELLAMFKKSIGRLDGGTELDGYYKSMIDTAAADLSTDDISEAALQTDLGKCAVVLYAIKLMNNEDIANNATINLMRNKLTAITRGEAYADGQESGSDS